MERIMDKKQEVEKKRWESPSLILIGTITDVVRAGGGKLSTPTDDSGEDPRKPSGLELDL